MKKRALFSFVLLLLLASTGHSAQGKEPGKTKWTREKIAPGLTWMSCHTLMYDTIPQNINILSVNLRKRELSLQYDPQKNIRTSIQAEGADAEAAVNAGFFNVKDGGSVTYIKVSGRIVDSDTAAKWPRNVNLNGALLIRSSHEVLLGKKMPNEWFDSHQEYGDVLVTGPLLIEDSRMCDLPATSLVTSRHPRTAVGTRNNHRIILITVDGRAAEAAGMTLSELAQFMLILKCRDALNLDGGGSTTMWIKGKPFNGVVNMPSDNRKWDHEGEKVVSDILVVR